MKKILQFIFSLRRENNHKVLTIFGIKIKYKSHKSAKKQINIEFESQKALNDNTINQITRNIQILNNVLDIHSKTFLQYKNINQNKDVVLIATGPSLKYFEPIENAVYIGVNKSFKYQKVKLDYLFFEDYSGAKDYINELEYYDCTKFFGINNHQAITSYEIPCNDWLIPESTTIRCKAKRFYSESPWLPQCIHPLVPFAYNLCAEPLYCYGSIMFDALQFALWTNPKRIFIVGMDNTTLGTFDNQKNKLNCLYVKEHMEEFKKFANEYYPETQIISVNPVGLQGIFTDIQQKSFEEYNKYNLFVMNHKSERMDANRADLFEESRRNFHKDRYNFALKYAKDKNILDAASGLGYGTNMLSGVAKSVIGIEYSKEAVDYANFFYRKNNCEFMQGDIRSLPYTDNNFDLITSFETIEHIPNSDKFLNEVLRTLKPNGMFICSVPNNWSSDEDNPYHIKTFNYKTFTKLLSEYFIIEHLYNQNSGTNWEENRGQKRGIETTTKENKKFAECYIAICRKN